MADDAALAAFQDALLAALAAGGDGDAVKARLLADAACEPFRDWVLAAEPRMLAVAVALVARWGARRAGPG